MERYDYTEAMVNDVLEYIEENEDLSEYTDRDELEEALNESAWVSDSVTGNASGSYYCNSWRAAEALAHNWDLLSDALHEFGYADDGVNPIDKGPEWCGVLVRCYLLGSAIAEALDRLDYDFEANHPDDDEAEEEAI